MDAGKEILFDERRQARAAEVGLRFHDQYHFDVITAKDEFDKKFPDLIKVKKGDVKHRGVIWSREPNAKDFCTCESFTFGNSDEYKKSHTFAFQCKHIHAARDFVFEGYPE